MSEVVRVRRRGGLGSILNSKSEYNRCHITRLRVEEKEEQDLREQEMVNRGSGSSTRLRGGTKRERDSQGEQRDKYREQETSRTGRGGWSQKTEEEEV